MTIGRPPRTVAVYAGSFDPLTFGHLDLIERADKLFDEVVVAIGVHPSKHPLFTFDERLALLQEVVKPFQNARIDRFDGLLINYCKRIGARVIVRGLRAATDFEYELQIAHANSDMDPSVDTVFLPTRANYGFISASLVREIASHGGSVSHYAPEPVCKALRLKFPDRGAAE